MLLFIAEKPSMAGEIAKSLPNAVKKNGYYETSTGDRVTWAYGHVLQQADPHEYNQKFKRWSAEDLPIIPEEWKLLVSPSCARQFEIIKKLIDEADEIVNAGDPDREGQLLIDEILNYVHCQKTVLRILLNALDEKSIKRALNDLRKNRDFYTLQQSALARSRADWLIGMNLSRAFTLSAQKAGHKGVYVVGRVKTPTISLVVRREEEIKNFKPINYYGVKADFQHENGVFQTAWQPKDTQNGLDPEGRMIDKAVINALVAKFKNEGRSGVITACEKSQKKEAHRLPYSLSALQIEAGRRFGYSPQEVLDIAQKLYEAKLTTYPRSDCDFLPENQFDDAKTILNNLKNFSGDVVSWIAGANPGIKSRAWNDKKITAHHAIIPTVQATDYKKLTEPEKNLYFLIAQAYIAQFYPVHVYDFTKITVEFSNETFTVSGRVVVEDGWKALFRKAKEDDTEETNEATTELPVVKKDDTVTFLTVHMNEKTTKPPVRFTASTLLQAMKEIHKFVKNQELKKQLKDVSGIGTEATRASIIKEIIDKGFLIEDKKNLIPTERAYMLVSLLPDELTYPDSTAEWEMIFNKMVDGSVKLEDFLDQQKEFITGLCQKAVTMEIQLATEEGEPCPDCGKGVLRSKKGKNGVFWGCSNYPNCKATFNDKEEKPLIIKCPTCNKGTLHKKAGSKGTFWGCSRYPDCRATFDDEKGNPQLNK